MSDTASGQIAPAPVSTDTAAQPGPAAQNPPSQDASDGGTGKAQPRDWERDARKFQSELDRERAAIAPIRERMIQYGLDPMRAANSLEQLATAWSHPELGPMLREFFSSGQVKAQAPKAPEEDRYVDPDLKALEEKYEARVQALEQRLGAVSQTSQLSASAQVAQTLRDYETGFLSRFPLSDDEKQSFREKMDERFQWMVRNQPQTLVQLQREVYEDLALPVVHRVVDVLSLGKRAANEQPSPAGRATDARLRASTTGAETAPNPKAFDHTPTLTEIQQVAYSAIEALRRDKGYTAPKLR